MNQSLSFHRQNSHVQLDLLLSFGGVEGKKVDVSLDFSDGVALNLLQELAESIRLPSQLGEPLTHAQLAIALLRSFDPNAPFEMEHLSFYLDHAKKLATRHD